MFAYLLDHLWSTREIICTYIFIILIDWIIWTKVLPLTKTYLLWKLTYKDIFDAIFVSEKYTYLGTLEGFFYLQDHKTCFPTKISAVLFVLPKSYIKIIAVKFEPLLLHPGALTQAIRNFAKSLESWLTNAMMNIPEEMVRIKVLFSCCNLYSCFHSSFFYLLDRVQILHFGYLLPLSHDMEMLLDYEHSKPSAVLTLPVFTCV